MDKIYLPVKSREEEEKCVYWEIRDRQYTVIALATCKVYRNQIVAALNATQPKCGTCGGSRRAMMLQQVTGEDWFLPEKLESHEEYKISTLDEKLCHRFTNGKMGDAYNVKYIPCPDCPPESGELAKRLRKNIKAYSDTFSSLGIRKAIGNAVGLDLEQAAARIDELEKALQEIAALEKECCPRCEGNGRLWADGKAHLPSEQVDTIPCGNCGGSGYILPENAQEIAAAALGEEVKDGKTD